MKQVQSIDNQQESLSARRLALECLQAILEQKTPLEESFEHASANHTLEQRDKAFARHLVSTTMRYYGLILALNQHLLPKPLPKRAAMCQYIIYLGITQLLLLDTPPHAVVHTSVELAKRLRLNQTYVNLVNAVLRRVAERGRGMWRKLEKDQGNTPTWLWQKWEATYGITKTRAITRLHRQHPPLHLTCFEQAEYWLNQLDAELLPNGSLLLYPEQAINSLPGFVEGAWQVQDMAASLPATLFKKPLRHQLVYDLCAAPGGKTVQLAKQGANVVAVDQSAPRLKRLAENLARLGVTADIIISNVLTWEPTEQADAILLDAPCTATGTIRRHPDVAWLKSKEDVTAMALTQQRLLEKAYSLLKVGGELIYSTCSLQPEEGENAIGSFLKKHKTMQRLPFDDNDIPYGEPLLTKEGDIRLLPCYFETYGGVDGFFISRLVKTKG
jgi:16S rRNA (cytosine967-C5)-methyltransferase